MNFADILQLVFSGLTIGCVYSLVGLGFALTLRATDLINFAQGEMVMLGAFIGLTLINAFPLPYYLVFFLSVTLSGVFGIFMERFILRKILDNKAPAFEPANRHVGYLHRAPGRGHRHLGARTGSLPRHLRPEQPGHNGREAAAFKPLDIVPGPGLHGRVAVFLPKDHDRHILEGGQFRPLHRSAFRRQSQKERIAHLCLSAALGGGAGVLIAPLFFASFGLGHSVLVKAFAAAAMGGFGVVGTMLGGLALGVIETLAAGLVSSEYKNVIMYLILLAILMFFFRPQIPSGRSITEGSKVVARRPVNLFGKESPLWFKVGAILAVVVFWLATPVVFDTYTMRILNMALIFAVAVLGLQLIVGYTGQFSFGHAAFFGIGAYTSALLSMHLGWSFFITMPLAAVAAGLVGWAVAPLLRLSGHFLAIGTLATGEIIFLLMINWKWLTKGAYGLYGIPFPSIAGFELDSDGSYFFLITAILALVYFLLKRLTNSRFGLGLIAVRENELAAMVNGVKVHRQKIKAFVIGTACAGIAGALYAHYVSYINPESFKFHVSVEMVTMVVIGGLGSMPGGLIGALVVVLLPEYLRALADYRLVVYGVMLIAFMMYLPGGIADLARSPISLLASKLGIKKDEVR